MQSDPTTYEAFFGGCAAEVARPKWPNSSMIEGMDTLARCRGIGLCIPHFHALGGRSCGSTEAHSGSGR